MFEAGGCHCGAVRFRFEAKPRFIAVCHCRDCRQHSGAVSVGWISVPSISLEVTRGEPKSYASSSGVVRQFCGDCGTGLFYYNEAFLPNMVDVQLTTLDNAAAIAPQMHLQLADALPWEEELGALPQFKRYPPGFGHFH